MALVVTVICVSIVAGVFWWRSTLNDSTAALVGRFPDPDAPIVYVDVAALRTSGLLRRLLGSAAAEDSEYRDFVDAIGFDYRTDLDSALVCFDSDATFFLVRGRFQWRRFTSYALEQGGSCVNSVCSVPGSVPSIRISFLPVAQDILALASSRSHGAVYALNQRDRPVSWSIPDAPLWYSTTGEQLSNAGWLPDGAKSFVGVLRVAKRVTLSLVSDETGYAATIQAECPTAPEAKRLANKLTEVTRLLNSLIARQDQTPNPADFSGVLTRGVFRSEGARLLGRWPVSDAFIENITASN